MLLCSSDSTASMLKVVKQKVGNKNRHHLFVKIVSHFLSMAVYLTKVENRKYRKISHGCLQIYPFSQIYGFNFELLFLLQSTQTTECGCAKPKIASVCPTMAQLVLWEMNLPIARCTGAMRVLRGSTVSSVAWLMHFS